MVKLEDDKMDDSEYGIEALKKISSISRKLIPQIKTLSKRIKSKELNIFKGDKFLGVKNQLLLDYITNLLYLVLRKLKGESIANSDVVDRLVEIRIVIDKMRPIEMRLKNEWERKLVSRANNSANDKDLNLRPNLNNLDSQDEEDDSNDSNNEEDKSKSKKSDEIYRPVKMAPKFYDGDLSKSQREEKIKEKMKKRAASSSMLQDLRNEFTDAPEEIKDDFDMHRLRNNRKEKEKDEYEESYFTRMQITKKQKMADRKMRTMGSLNNITKFSDIRALMGEEIETSGSSKKKKVPTANLR